MPCGDVRIRREGSGTATGREEGRVVTDGGRSCPGPSREHAGLRATGMLRRAGTGSLSAPSGGTSLPAPDCRLLVSRITGG